MIEVGTAVGVSEDTGVVELEAKLVSLDGNGQWVHGEGGLHGGWIVRGDGNEGFTGSGGGANWSVWARVVAGTILSGVWGGALVVGIVAGVVSESSGLVTAIAAERKLNAVNELLLGKLEQCLVVVDAVGGLQSRH